MKIFKWIVIALVILIALAATSAYFTYNHLISAVDKSSDANIEVIIPEGVSSKQIAKILYEKNLIRNETAFVIYLRLNNEGNLKASKYILKKNMNIKEIITVLQSGNNYNPDRVFITFNEGINMRRVASVIATNTNNTEDSVYELLKDSSYLDELIENYWFLTDEIKNEKIYYSLEGYFAPNTYELKNKDISVKEIFKILLDETNTILSKEKESIEKSNFTVHELLTLASMVELEVKSSEARKNVAGLFLNRLNLKMNLGSDVTTYYAIKADSEEAVREYTLQYGNPYTASNSYNTRASSMAGKLPVGPVANPSSISIDAVINYIPNDYLYFVTGYDEEKLKNGEYFMNIHYSKTLYEHEQKVNELKRKGLFISW